MAESAVKAEASAVKTIEQARTAAIQSANKASDAVRSHGEAIGQAEAALRAHEGNGIGSIELLSLQPEWREKRQALASDIDRLRNQTAYLDAAARLAGNEVRRITDELQAATQKLYRARLNAMIEGGALDRAMKDILVAWDLNVRGYNRLHERSDADSISRWFFGFFGRSRIDAMQKDLPLTCQQEKRP